MNRILIPATELTDWQKLLADPVKHWRDGYSAMAIANSWHFAEGFPGPIARLFGTAGQPLCSLQPLIIIPEHKVKLDGGGRDSQNDVWVLAKHDGGLASITVEGKVLESFGETLSDWLKDASPGKRQRLEFLQRTLGLTAEIPATIRYQLLHRSASALLEARRFGANLAVMVVQSFSGEDTGSQDYRAFAALFGADAGVNQVVHVGIVDGVTLYLAWVRDALTPVRTIADPD